MVQQGRFVYCCNPLDWFQPFTKTVNECGFLDLPSEFSEDYRCACLAVACHQFWDGERRHEDYVMYGPEVDGYYFAFKLNNNGTTFLVTETPHISSVINHTYLLDFAEPNPLYVPITVTGGDGNG